MIAVCVKCKARLSVPDDRAKPDLRLKCPGCGLVFPLAKARKVENPSAGSGPVSRGSTQPELRAVSSSGAVPAAGSSGAIRAPSASGAQASPVASRGPRSGAELPRCVNHADVACAFACERCERFYCDACVQRVQGRPLCAPCQFFVTRISDWEAREAVLRRRARPLMEEIRPILLYPFSDPVAFAILALIVWVLNLSMFVIGPALSYAFLMAYSFRAVTRVSDGHMVFSVPDVSDINDLVHFFLLGIASYLVSWGPFSMALVNLGGSILGAAFSPEGMRALTVDLLAVVLTFLWGLLYAPMALVVAAISDTFFETLNPVAGLRTIKRMGMVYWQAAAIYTSLVVGQVLLTWVIGSIPVVGGVVASVSNTFVYIAAGCALGLAVDKKSEELGYG